MQSDTPPIVPDPENQKRNNTPIIIGAVVVVILCCCCIALGALWQFGELDHAIPGNVIHRKINLRVNPEVYL